MYSGRGNNYLFAKCKFIKAFSLENSLTFSFEVLSFSLQLIFTKIEKKNTFLCCLFDCHLGKKCVMISKL